MQATDKLNPEVNHYKDCKIQPIDYITANNMSFLEGNIIKYVTRYKAKGGVEDLRKAKNYLDWLINSVEAEGKGSTWEKEAMDALHKTMVDFGIPKAYKDAKKIAKRKAMEREEYYELCEEIAILLLNNSELKATCYYAHTNYEIVIKSDSETAYKMTDKLIKLKQMRQKP